MAVVACLGSPAAFAQDAAPPQDRNDTPVVVPLWSAFTIHGFEAVGDEGLFSEYVLQAARPQSAPEMTLAQWSPAEDGAAPSASTVRLAAAEDAILPPKRPAFLATSSIRKSARPADDSGRPAVAALTALLDLKPVASMRRWMSALPAPDIRPAQQKVAVAITSLGGRIAGLLPGY